jgi:hypothetical protein
LKGDDELSIDDLKSDVESELEFDAQHEDSIDEDRNVVEVRNIEATEPRVVPVEPIVEERAIEGQVEDDLDDYDSDENYGEADDDLCVASDDLPQGLNRRNNEMGELSLAESHTQVKVIRPALAAPMLSPKVAAPEIASVQADAAEEHDRLMVQQEGAVRGEPDFHEEGEESIGLLRT